MTLSPSSRLRSIALASTVLLTGGVLLAGCASASAEPEAAATEQSADTAQTARTPSGVSGLIASADDGLLQVQGSDTQTAVRYTDATTVTKSVAIDASTVAVGSCVTIVTDEEGTTATSITVTAAADDGTCSLGGGGGFPGGGAGSEMSADGERPEGMPTDMPSGAPDGSSDAQGGPGGDGAQGGGFGGFTAGTVTAVADGVITVESTGFGDDAETTSTDVTITADTSATGTVAATSADIAAGLCVTAAGEADDAGGYDATSLALSDADENGECSTGFGGFPGGGAPGATGQGDDE